MPATGGLSAGNARAKSSGKAKQSNAAALDPDNVSSTRNQNQTQFQSQPSQSRLGNDMQVGTGGAFSSKVYRENLRTQKTIKPQKTKTISPVPPPAA